MKTFLVLVLAILPLCAPKSINGRVNEGEIASEGQFPYQISLEYYLTHVCSGSIINPSTILTAAHCVDISGQRFLTVVVGRNYLMESGVVHSVKKQVAHEEFDSITFEHDIGLLKLTPKISYNDRVQPIALKRSHVGEGVDLIFSGWGRSAFPGTESLDLQFIRLKTVSNERCKYDHFFPPINDTQICTLTLEEKSTCAGDPGGPLVLENKQVGILSWDQPCGVKYPDIFTRVSSYIDWIKANK
ncbi:hypothetical protein FQA39_LY15716 [Lamprigera yunnana]|nr:hypothetical protein FQA39_LY15716 [Lamprigera yunnana]